MNGESNIDDSVFKRIDSIFNTLSKQHKVVANAILQNKYDFINYTAEKMSDKLKVSSATIVRFARVVGYEGYPELQRAIKKHYANERRPLKKLADSFEISNNEVEIYNNICRKDKETIDNLDISKESISRALDMMMHAKKVYIIAGRATFSLAYFLGFMLRQIDSRFTFFNSSLDFGYEQIMSLSKNDLLIAISFNGYYKMTHDLVELANENEVPVISITDYPTSPITTLSSLCFYIPNEASFCSYTAAMPLLNTLIVAFAARTKETNKEFFETNLEIVLQSEVYLTTGGKP